MPIIYIFLLLFGFLPGWLKDYNPLGRRPCPKVLGILLYVLFFQAKEKNADIRLENKSTAEIEVKRFWGKKGLMESVF